MIHHKEKGRYPDFEIKTAVGLSKCDTSHYNVDTKDVPTALKSFQEQIDEANDPEVKDNHGYELNALINSYAYLLNEAEVLQMKKISLQKDKIGKLASTFIDIRKKGLLKK